MTDSEERILFQRCILQIRLLQEEAKLESLRNKLISEAEATDYYYFESGKAIGEVFEFNDWLSRDNSFSEKLLRLEKYPSILYQTGS